MMESNRIYDYTTIDTFQTCRKKYYYWGVRHLQTRTKSPALLFGGAIHDALDLYYTKGLDVALENFRETYQDRETDDLRTVANGVKLMEWYAKVYHTEPFEIMGKPETGFVFPIGDVLWGGRMDLPVKWKQDGSLWIMEHKTTSKVGFNFFNQFDLDKQITGYILAMEAFTGQTVQGCLVNLLQPWKEVKRVTAKTKKPEDHFIRAPQTRTKELKERFKLNVHRIVRDINWCEENNEFYEAEKKDICFYYNYDCPYKGLCLYGEDERIIKRDYVVEKWSPYSLNMQKKEALEDQVADAIINNVVKGEN